MVNEIIGEVDLHKIVSYFRDSFGPMPYGSEAFETASPIGEEDRQALVKGMLSLPGNSGHQLFRQSSNLRQISDDAATHKALETMYVGPRPEEDEDKFFWARLFMEDIHNSMAVRNRLRIVRQEFRNFVGGVEGEQIHVLSVAAGSSRGLLEETAKLPKPIADRIQLKLIDISPQAGEDARGLSQQLGIEHQVETVTGNVLKVNGYLEDGYRADFIEVVGLLDYLEKEVHVRNLLRRLRVHLSGGGMVLYSNIMPNDEKDFTHKIVVWPQMEYRSAEDLEEFAKQAGFPQHTIRVIAEPLGIYNIVCAKQE